MRVVRAPNSRTGWALAHMLITCFPTVKESRLGSSALSTITDFMHLGKTFPPSGKALGFTHVVQPIYAPTTDYSDAELEQFYEQIRQLTKQVKSTDILIIMGDLNAKVGNTPYPPTLVVSEAASLLVLVHVLLQTCRRTMHSTYLNSAPNEAGMNISGQNINNIRYADDTALVAETPEQLQALLDKVNEESENCGLAMNAKKTKVMVISRKDITPKININIGNTVLEQVSTFIYLGQLISDDNRADQDIKRRIGIAKTSFNSLLNTFTSNSISMKTKLQLLKTFVWSTLLYGSETWSISKAQMNKIEAFEMYAFRRIGKISWRQKLTNYEVLQKLNIRREIGQCIRDMKLQYYGHLMRHENVIRDLYNGEVEGSRGRGRPRTKWNDNIAEWTCYSLVQCQRLAQDRCQWRAIAANLRKETAPG
ncbi:hypothetical protein EGW08_005070 [Elysia chlorotica]|uniref:Reverse transcriptase domain-containing protein n=1 Tax=Elysia chlorotica TaxID=188477 RepID=A0A433U071_ELYCH|nr:hypothetical protein EGW08_005070 [Elysia chlorotica]